MDDPALRAMKDAIAFLRRAANQLRGIAETAPDLAEQLLATANQLDMDAKDLEGRATGSASG